MALPFLQVKSRHRLATAFNLADIVIRWFHWYDYKRQSKYPPPVGTCNNNIDKRSLGGHFLDWGEREEGLEILTRLQVMMMNILKGNSCRRQLAVDLENSILTAGKYAMSHFHLLPVLEGALGQEPPSR